ncbi:unnamed protein product [Brassica napus]|uniref:(rape) hypothetical protein n=1 Tax=Brassica napus TaxID=3708 RepID=A0A817ANI7_BRANA|nr:unnamed protein product [Brassica napus]
MTILPLGSCNATYNLFNFETTYTLFLMRHQNRYNTHLSPSIFHRSFFGSSSSSPSKIIFGGF